MNISELCIRRPAMTVLLSAAVVVIGIFAYFSIPVAAARARRPRRAPRRPLRSDLISPGERP
jgi:hypothetical protein